MAQGTLGKGKVKEGPIHPLGNKRHCQVEFRGSVAWMQKTRTLLEVSKYKKGHIKKVDCIQRDFPAPGFKSASQASSQKLSSLIHS